MLFVVASGFYSKCLCRGGGQLFSFKGIMVVWSVGNFLISPVLAILSSVVFTGVFVFAQSTLNNLKVENMTEICHFCLFCIITWGRLLPTVSSLQTDPIFPFTAIFCRFGGRLSQTLHLRHDLFAESVSIARAFLPQPSMNTFFCAGDSCGRRRYVFRVVRMSVRSILMNALRECLHI